MKKGIYISKSHNPFENQSIEAHLFHKMIQYDMILMLYINEPCVVIGRNQNPWIEVHTKIAQRKNISVLRRLSGGGTVYHDLGNLNFSFIYNKEVASPKENFETVLLALESLGIPLEVNQRNDLCYKDYKISGNAFYNRGKRHMHHGTLLIDTDFSDLWQILRFDKEAFQSRSISSVKSPVMNLNKIDEQVTVEHVIKALQVQFQGDQMSVPVVLDDHYQTWEWVYGQTPQFDYKGVHDFKVKYGKVIEIDGLKKEELERFTLD